MAPHINEVTRARILQRLEDGWSTRQLAVQFNVGKSTVDRIKQKWRQQETLSRSLGTGLRKVSTVEQDEALVNFIRENPFEFASTAVEAANFPGSVRTAQKRLRASELKNCSAANKPFLTEQNKQQRLEFANEFINRDATFWNSIVFSDEKVFQSCHSGRVRVYRPVNARYDERYVHKVSRSGHFGVNMWVWIRS